MSTRAKPAGGADADAGSDAAHGPASIQETLRAGLGSLKAQWLGIVDLAALETKFAALTLVEMLALALAAALFAITAWWLLMAAVTAQLLALGLPLALALLLIGLLNIAMALTAVARIRSLQPHLDFKATRHAISEAAHTETDDEEAAVGLSPTQS